MPIMEQTFANMQYSPTDSDYKEKQRVQRPRRIRERPRRHKDAPRKTFKTTTSIYITAARHQEKPQIDL